MVVITRLRVAEIFGILLLVAPIDVILALLIFNDSIFLAGPDLT